ncbi:hypothetical protein JG688_00017903 [Phytophthora aleatoria]|uniref:Uncharacterized protein n=1 Tax=Phytophthora aleatoria TaxID=2496075 RepID=A0A8J5MBG7_9STRA|nr:hypothetical protein JG688_00017903 [Phytophthora aleatoria]
MWKSVEREEVPPGQLRCTFVLKPLVADLEEILAWSEMATKVDKLITKNLSFSEMDLHVYRDPQMWVVRDRRDFYRFVSTGLRPRTGFSGLTCDGIGHGRLALHLLFPIQSYDEFTFRNEITTHEWWQ